MARRVRRCAARELRKLAASDRQRILRYLRERLATDADPRRLALN
jgi:mRNA-degrading endonuclease RelE of RelBE toxin-antitoxin system